MLPKQQHECSSSERSVNQSDDSKKGYLWSNDWTTVHIFQPLKICSFYDNLIQETIVHKDAIHGINHSRNEAR